MINKILRYNKKILKRLYIILIFSLINLLGYLFIENPYIYFIGICLWNMLFYLSVKNLVEGVI